MTYHRSLTQVSRSVRVGPSSRVVIPAGVREHLEVGEGDRLEFVVLTHGEVRLVSARQQMRGIWAKNTGGDAGDSARDLRLLRNEDTSVHEARWEGQPAADESHLCPDEAVTDDVLGRLGL